MSLSAKLRRAPLRLATGAYILNSGIGKLSADDEAAKTLHGAASGTYPVLGNAQPKVFAKGLAITEITVGSALLLPIVPPVVAGAALAAFSGALLNMYWHTPGMHQEGNPRPTAQGAPVAKDVWMFGIGAGLIADSLLSPAHDKHVELNATVSEKRAEKGRRAKRKARKAAAKANADTLREVQASAKEAQAEAGKRMQEAVKSAQDAAKSARKQAEQVSREMSERPAKLLDEARGAEHRSVAKAKQVGQAARGVAEEYGPLAAEKAAEKAKYVRDAAREYGPLAAEKAAEKAKNVRDAARHAADEYGPLAAEKAKQVRHAAHEAGVKARERVAS